MCLERLYRSYAHGKDVETEAEQLLAEIKTQFPDAITHCGRPFAEFLK